MNHVLSVNRFTQHVANEYQWNRRDWNESRGFNTFGLFPFITSQNQLKMMTEQQMKKLNIIFDFNTILWAFLI